MTRLPSRPELDWLDEGAPRARDYDDIYFSRAGGLAESEAVFLAGCGLPDAWARRQRFAIGELGFGAGLNALAVWRAWRATRAAGAILHFVSVEAFPLARADGARALAAFPEVQNLAAKLLARWPAHCFGAQRLWFEDDGFVLTVIVGDAAAALAGLEARFDAWFLDGFAPARNPAMWSEALIGRIAELSAPGARLATYSVAGPVRRALGAAGFSVEKKQGFASKRERLEARLPESTTQTQGFPGRVAVIGAGIAGAALAEALARRGCETVMIEGASGLGAAGSGNPAGLVMPRLDRAGALAEVHLTAFLGAVSAYERLGPEVFTPCGIVEAPASRRNDALADLLVDPPLDQDWIRPLDEGAMLHARAGVARPLRAISAWTARASLMTEARVARIEQSSAGWRLLTEAGREIISAEAVVLASGAGLCDLAALAFVPFERTLGQVEWGVLRAPAPPHARAAGSYYAPFDGSLVFGATFDKADADTAVLASADARARNLAALARLAPNLAGAIDEATLSSRAALRVSTPDRAPIAGAVPDAPAWRAHFAHLAHGRKPATPAPAPMLNGLYVLGALGARGLTLAPVLAENLVSEMFGEPPMLSQRARAAIHPGRFVVRAIKRARP